MQKKALPKLMLLVLVAIFVIAAIFLYKCVNNSVRDTYTSNNPYLEISTNYKQGDIFKFKDIFRFKFSKAYIISDYSLTVNEINEKYCLNIKNIKLGTRLDATQNKNLRRIVFVDSNNNYIMDSSYDTSSEFVITEEEITVYPDTRIRISGYIHIDNTDSESDSVIICDVLDISEKDRLKLLSR